MTCSQNKLNFFLWHSIHVKDKFYLNFSSKKVGYQKLILSVLISKFIIISGFTRALGFTNKKLTKLTFDTLLFWRKIKIEFVFDMYGVPQKNLACSGNMSLFTIVYVFYKALVNRIFPRPCQQLQFIHTSIIKLNPLMLWIDWYF